MGAHHILERCCPHQPSCHRTGQKISQATSWVWLRFTVNDCINISSVVLHYVNTLPLTDMMFNVLIHSCSHFCQKLLWPKRSTDCWTALYCLSSQFFFLKYSTEGSSPSPSPRCVLVISIKQNAVQLCKSLYFIDHTSLLGPMRAKKEGNVVMSPRGQSW